MFHTLLRKFMTHEPLGAESMSTHTLAARARTTELPPEVSPLRKTGRPAHLRAAQA